MTSLIARLEALTGPDREVDEEIQAYLFPDHKFMGLADAPHLGCVMYTWPDGQQVSALRITSSVDAAIALAERVLPGWVFDYIGQNYHSSANGYEGIGWCVELINGQRVQGQAATLPLAICIAILKAKEASNG